jgi:LacI family transcriptional regulator
MTSAAGPQTPKYLSVAEAIEAQVASGKWEGGRRLPSVRGIAVQHKVSVVTASRALQVLRDKGLVQTRERSGCYRTPPPTAERWAVCLRLTPGAWQQATTAQSRSGFELLARRQSMHLSFDSFELTPDLTADDARTAADRARADGVGGVFLLPSRTDDADATFLAGCRAAGLPVVLFERNPPGTRSVEHHDLVCLDDVTGAAAATRHLLALGRRRVGLVVGSATSSHNDRLAGYLYALCCARQEGGRRSAELAEIVLKQPAKANEKESYAALADLVVKEKLDGVLCYSDYTALGLVMDLLRRGVRVPKDVAVAGFDNLPFGDSFAVGLTTTDYPAEAMADHALRLMRERVKHPDRPPVKVCVPGKLIVRGSTNPEA